MVEGHVAIAAVGVQVPPLAPFNIEQSLFGVAFFIWGSENMNKVGLNKGNTEGM